MAQGTLVVFNEFKQTLGQGEHILGTDTFFGMLIKATATDPLETDSDPGWSVSRTQDWSSGAYENSTAGNYTAGGNTCGVSTWTPSGNSVILDLPTDLSWTGSGSNPGGAGNEVQWCGIYNSTDADKKGMCFIDLGTNFDMQTGDLTITFDAGGLWTLT